ncbi:MAG TPA: c-type cytochrome [Candidatus Sulfotelmatobacter sp.]|nr:c-type cytochrome [Candidatus Sulfotelmatobacter sp.]
MTKKLLGAASTLLLIFAFSISAIKTKAQSSAAAANPGPKKAEEVFKNIQVLKGIPADQVFPTMQFITASLGVECDFCHVRDAFEKDDKKPKATARKMMEMMFAINSDNFDRHRAVTCYSCHRGSVQPAAIPAVMIEEPRQPMGEPHRAEADKASSDAKESTGPTADQLLDKYIQAVGGASAVDKISSRVMKGSIDFSGKSLPIDIYARDPEKRISLTHMPNGDSVTAFNGKEGWLGTPGRPLREMHGSDLDGAAIDADLHLATDFKQMFSKMRVEGTEKIDDHQTQVVVGERQDKTPIRLYFDEQSGLLVRLVRFGETALGWLPTQIDYADYRELNGVKVPYRWTLARPSGKFTIQVSEMQQNVPVDDAKFVKPEAPQEQPKAPAK